ncbi:CynX/NimT family MFS transporter [Gulbenkiania mobilis]|uniref:CynX/NimT family MFS transporter n=1 Tax=Gulbenkiania mobilis TaxID=397457 RepID=UPI0006BBC930|nr:CynX/NimT family MFS transporter [Gulbenkiania mobilis]
MPPVTSTSSSVLIDAEIDDDGVQHTPPPSSSPWLLLIGLVLVGMNLRPALSSVSPMLNQIKATTGLSGTLAGLLTTLPVLCLGLFGPLAPALARRFGAERAIALILITLALGVFLRTRFGLPGLFGGSIVAGASIGIIGVLLPGIVKRDFPRQASLMTGVYTMALCLGAALAAGATIPIGRLFGGDWHPALAFWALPALLALAVWWPQLRGRSISHHGQWTVSGLWRDPLAWQVTGYMGLQSSLAYIVFGWLPPMLIDRGLAPLAAGLMLSLSVMVQVLTALAGPALAQRSRDQRGLIAVMVMLTLAGLMGMLFAPPASLWMWAVLLGLGQGGTFSLALALLVLRTPDPHVASHLSGMAQGVGYTLASLGPLAVGLIHDLADSWTPVAVLLGGIAAAALACGLLAGRDRLVQARARPL